MIQHLAIHILSIIRQSTAPIVATMLIDKEHISSKQILFSGIEYNLLVVHDI